MIDSDYFKFFGNCIPVKGAKRSIICDLFRSKFYYIPNELFSIINNNNEIDLDDLRLKKDSSYLDTLYEYLTYFITHDVGFFTNTPYLFPRIDLNRKFPSTITNAIIDFNEKTDILNDKYKSVIIVELSSLGCKCTELRFFFTPSIQKLKKILRYFYDERIEDIRLIIKYSDEIDSNIQSFIYENGRITSCLLYASKKNEVRNHLDITVEYITSTLSPNDCGNICLSTHEIGVEFFSEAKNFNTCLNKKISIDINGNLKNCPSSAKSYGSIYSDRIIDIVANAGFKKYWNLNKDKIHVCKNCEFRYICTDCRAYVEDPDDILSKPLKCGYNPYTGEWSEWSDNPLKQKAIDFYGMREMVDEMNRAPK